MLKIGFTGTRKGLTSEQREKVTSHLRNFRQQESTRTIFNHGGCVGADEQAAIIAGNLGYWTIEFPSDILSKRTTFISHESHDPKAPLDRNKDIVKKSDIVIGCPAQEKEVKRSGTWATIRYAKKKGKAVFTIYPSGRVEVTHGRGN